jgi:hypothetical protein
MDPSHGVTYEKAKHPIVCSVSSRHLEDLSLANILDRLACLPLYNDNKGAPVEWLSGLKISKKLWHINIQEIAVCDTAFNNLVDVQHVPGLSNIAGLFNITYFAFQLL